jgi:hypothetical protein
MAVGAGSSTVTEIRIAAEAEPPALDAVTVYDASGARAVGVPEIMPVELLRFNPAGSAGLTAYEVTSPETEGTSLAIATFVAASIFGSLYERSVGGVGKLTVIWIVVAVDPLLLAAVTV